ncbi:MAG: DUF368 domain-containing protein [Firmicutes bacterium]|nr:DUF368 domain-containing protein [Bacillota bacterium]
MYLKNLFLGIIVGIGFIIPGVSGGVLATILGIYDTIIYKLNHFFKDLKNNILYLAPLIIGIIISILFFSKLILYLLNNKLNFISYVFIGLILGCVPYLLREIKFKTNKKMSMLSFFMSLLFGCLLFLIENNSLETFNNPGFITMLIAGVLYAIGKIVPGISGAALLMLLGIYEYFLSVVANPFAITFETIINFIPFIISFLFSSIIILKLIDYLLSKHFRITYSAIIGFIISSILFIYPGYFSFLSLIIASLAFLISYNLSNKK